MSKLRAGIGEAMYSVKKWAGVNENPDGDTNLKSGEAAEMKNFRITDDGALRKRPGTAVVAGLAQAYELVADTSKEITLLQELGESTHTWRGYPEISADSVGNAVYEGQPVLFNINDYEKAVGYYVSQNDGAYQFARVEKAAPAELAHITAEDAESGKYDIISTDYKAVISLLAFNSPPEFENGEWKIDAGVVVNLASNPHALLGRYVIVDEEGKLPYMSGIHEREEYAINSKGKYAYIYHGWTKIEPSFGYVVRPYYTTYEVSRHNWKFYQVVNRSAGFDAEVRGLWSGFVGDTEYIVAACNGFLWTLYEDNGVWRKQSIGAVDTTEHVCLFGFGGKLYCLDGKDYFVWDGESFGAVEGYIPIVALGSSPDGKATTLERVNLLTAKRRQRFSADGEATEYKLAESGLRSIDKVAVDGAVVSGYEAVLTEGKVKFSSAPAKGIENVEVWYTASTDYRNKVVRQKYYEFYNGVNDSRVFLYGDGSNVCIYSDIEYTTGMPSAEYFPDLNEIGVGDSNTPLTSLIRQYNRLMAFKRGGSAHSIYYDTITLADGTVTAGFYCNSVNRSIGNDAMGQACLVENKPRTLDGRSIYEWKSAGGGNITYDIRNAERVSQKIENSLKSFDIEKSIMFFDKIKHEFYVIYDGKAVVQNTENGAWYVYDNFPATALIIHKDDLYYGTANGQLRRVSDDYASDSGAPIECYWESGSMSFGKDYMEKYSPCVWVGLKQEEGAAVEVGIETNNGEKIWEEIQISGGDAMMPGMNRRRLKAQKFTYYKLLFRSTAAENRATIVAADVSVKYNINIK